MSESQNRTPEQIQQHETLVQASEVFLAGKEAFAGRAYREIKLPLGWLIGGRYGGVSMGYKIDKQNLWRIDLGSGSNRMQDETELEKDLARLKSYGIKRHAHNYGSVGGWVGSVSLGAYQDATLQNRQLIPVSNEIIYNLNVRIDNEDGRATYPYEHFVYSSTNPDILQYNLDDRVVHYEPEDRETRPLVRAATHLQNNTPPEF